MKTAFFVTPMFALLLLLASIAIAAQPVHSFSIRRGERIYVHREKGQQTQSIILRSDGTMLYGNGSRFGTRHRTVSGFYKIKGKIISLFEFNGTHEIQHETCLLFTPNILGGGKYEKLYQRL